jgi:thioredoxin 1
MNLAEFQSVLSSNPAFMLYFYNNTCGVCKTLWPRVEALIQDDFPELKLYRINALESRELAGQMRMLSVPGMMVFMDGREVFRANGMLTMDELHHRIERPYGIMFE